jgi:hypothetical protein
MQGSVKVVRGGGGGLWASCSAGPGRRMLLMGLAEAGQPHEKMAEAEGWMEGWGVGGRANKGLVICGEGTCEVRVVM